MHLNPYGRDAVLLAADLANDRPRTVDELRTRCAAAGLAVERPPEPGDLARTVAYLDRWTEVVDADDEPERARRLNALLAGSAAYPRLTDHLGTGWHIHYRDDDRPLADVLRPLLGVGTALHLAGRGMHRLGRCEAEDCRRMFADVSRTGRQRFCRHACANRDAVRRHRDRRR